MAKLAKRSAISKAEFIAVRCRAIRDGARRGGWLSDRVAIALALADVELAARAVYDRKRKARRP